MKLDALVFDLDDTLIYTIRHYKQTKRTCYQLMAEAGLNLDHADELFNEIEKDMVAKHGFAAHRYPTSLRMLYKELCYAHGVQVDHLLAHRIEGIGWALYDVIHSAIPGVRTTLHKYVAGCENETLLVLFTKGDPLVQNNKIDRADLATFFHHTIVTPDKTVEAYEKLAVTLDVNPVRCVMVGDSIKSDINPAGKAGFHTVWIPQPEQWALEVEHPTVEHHRLDTIVDLSRIVKYDGTKIA